MSLEMLLENSEEVGAMVFEQIIQDGIKDAFLAGNEETQAAITAYVEALEEDTEVDSAEFLAFEESVSEFVAPFMETSSAIYETYLLEVKQTDSKKDAVNSAKNDAMDRTMRGAGSDVPTPKLPGKKDVASDLKKAEDAYKAYDPATPATKGSLLHRMRIRLQGGTNKAIRKTKEAGKSFMDKMNANKVFGAPMRVHAGIMAKGGYAAAMRRGLGAAGAIMRHPISAVKAVRGAIANRVMKHTSIGEKSMAKYASSGAQSRAVLSAKKAKYAGKLQGSTLRQLVKKPA